jgi:hypothetical protein
MRMTLRTFYWLCGTLFLIFQAGVLYFSFYSPHSTLVLISLIGSNIIGAVFAAAVLIQSWPPKNTTRRLIYWFGSILFVVLQVDYLISSPRSILYLASFVGIMILVAAYAADMVIQHWSQISAVIKKLRRPPLD